MIHLYKDPTGEKVFENFFSSNAKEYKTSEVNGTIPGISDLPDAEKVPLLQSRLTVLENVIQEKDVKISELKNILNS